MLNIFNQHQNNIVSATSQLLRRLNIKVSNTTIENMLEEHPDYPSLLSIADSLKTWKVDSVGVKVTYDQLLTLSCPILVYFKGNLIYLLTNINNASISYINENNRDRTLSKEEFLKQWDGIALLSDRGNYMEEVDYEQKHRTEVLRRIRIPVALLVVLFLILKHDHRIFDALLPKQKTILLEAIQPLGITLGDSKAKHHLVNVCNPYCGPCARAHPEIEKILEGSPDISVRIIFTATDNEKDIKSKPVKHLMAIDEMGDKEMTKQALDDWYLASKKDYEVFASKYPFNGKLRRQGEKLKAMSEWCEKTGISYTPTFFVSSLSPLERARERLYQLPDMYSVEDLKYLLI